MKTLGAIFVGLSILDAALTLHFAGSGNGYELNPVMRQVLEQPAYVMWLVKAGGSIFFASALLLLSLRFPRFVKNVFILLVIMMVAICLFNGLMVMAVEAAA